MSPRPVVPFDPLAHDGPLLAAPGSRAELAAWDQAKATALANELQTAADALYGTFIKRPPPVLGSMQITYYRLKQQVRLLRLEARELAASLEKGEGREQTLPIYDHLMQRVRIARDEAAKIFNTEDVGQRAAAVRGVLNQPGPYYDPDFQTLAPIRTSSRVRTARSGSLPTEAARPRVARRGARAAAREPSLPNEPSFGQ